MKNRISLYTTGLALLLGCASPVKEDTSRTEPLPQLTLTNAYFTTTIKLTPEGTEHFMRYGPQEAERQLERVLDEYTGDLVVPELKPYIRDINQRRTREKLDLLRSKRPKQPDIL